MQRKKARLVHMTLIVILVMFMCAEVVYVSVVFFFGHINIPCYTKSAHNGHIDSQVSTLIFGQLIYRGTKW
jgi:flagellar basal body-associated protein FliL